MPPIATLNIALTKAEAAAVLADPSCVSVSVASLVAAECLDGADVRPMSRGERLLRGLRLMALFAENMRREDDPEKSGEENARENVRRNTAIIESVGGAAEAFQDLSVLEEQVAAFQVVVASRALCRAHRAVLIPLAQAVVDERMDGAAANAVGGSIPGSAPLPKAPGMPS